MFIALLYEQVWLAILRADKRNGIRHGRDDFRRGIFIPTNLDTNLKTGPKLAELFLQIFDFQNRYSHTAMKPISASTP